MDEQRREFDRLYEQHKGLVTAFLRFRLRDAEELEEAFQDTWFAFYEALGRTRPEHPRAFLLKIAARRSRQRPRLTPATETRDESSLAAPSPTEGLRSLVGQAIERLAPERREVFVLKHKIGLSYDEIALVLDIPAGTVASRLHAAVSDLRTALRREGLNFRIGETA